MKQLISLTLVSLTIACGKPSIEEEDFAIQPAPQPAIETTTKTATATATTSTTTTTVATTTTEVATTVAATTTTTTATTATEAATETTQVAVEQPTTTAPVEQNAQRDLLVDFFGGQTYTNIAYNIYINDAINYNEAHVLEAIETFLASPYWGEAVKNEFRTSVQVFEIRSLLPWDDNLGGYASDDANHAKYSEGYISADNSLEQLIESFDNIVSHELTHMAHFDFTPEQQQAAVDFYNAALESDITAQIIEYFGGGYYHPLANVHEFVEYMSSIYVDDLRGVQFSLSSLENELLDELGMVDFLIETGIIQ